MGNHKQVRCKSNMWKPLIKHTREVERYFPQPRYSISLRVSKPTGTNLERFSPPPPVQFSRRIIWSSATLLPSSSYKRQFSFLFYPGNRLTDFPRRATPCKHNSLGSVPAGCFDYSPTPFFTLSHFVDVWNRGKCLRVFVSTIKPYFIRLLLWRHEPSPHYARKITVHKTLIEMIKTLKIKTAH